MRFLSRHWLQLVAIVLLLGALAPVALPFAYYQVMNWVTVIAASMVAYRAHAQKKEWIMWIFVAVAVVFNPVAPLHLRADVWMFADVVAAVLFAASFVLVAEKVTKTQK